MKLLFYGNRRGLPGDILVRFWTSSIKDKLTFKWLDSFSHVEIAFSTEQMFSSCSWTDGTRFTKASESVNWTAVEIPTNKEQAVLTFCVEQLGKKYDWWGVLGFVLGNKDSKDKWFCSEVCTAALQEAGMLEGIDPAKVSPNALYKLVTAKDWLRSV